ncbi:MAG: TolC family protein [Candidatus Caenarcaniphilales bacterium]|nr:TolC family protein [Candidatus Caenarcaniphilales bacterium]
MKLKFATSLFLIFNIASFPLSSLSQSELKLNEGDPQSIWADFDVKNPNLPLKAQAGEKIQAKDRLEIKSEDPFKIIKELKDPSKPKPRNKYLSGDEDPAGDNLERELPLDKPLSQRFQDEIWDPIELDVNLDEIVDLSIEKALLISLQSNLPQRIIDETVIRDKWRFWGTASGLLPDGFFAYSLEDQPQSVSQFPGTSHRNQLGIRYNFAPSEIFGTLASYYDWMANSQFQGASLQELMRQTTNQYYEVMRARGELAVRIEAVKQAKVQLELNEKLEEAGVGTKFAVLQAREQFAENELALLEQQSAARIAEIQLLTTLNMPLGVDILLEETQLMRKTLISPDYNMSELVGIALESRPDISRRQLAFQAARHRVKESVLSAIEPTFDAEVSTFRIKRRFKDAFSADRINGLEAVTFEVGLPILTGLGLGQISPINENRALSRQAGLELENEMLTVENEVRDAFLRSQSADKQIGIAEKQLQAATEGIKLARIRLANGVGTNIDLIDTQRNYVNALVNKVRAIVEYNQAQVDILRSIGMISIENILERALSFRASNPFDSSYVEDNQDDEFEDAGYTPQDV